MSQYGICSRREADRYIEQGQVVVHGDTAVLGQRFVPQVTPKGAIELVDAAARARMSLLTVLLHKPPGWVSSQPGGKPLRGRNFVNTEHGFERGGRGNLGHADVDTQTDILGHHAAELREAADDAGAAAMQNYPPAIQLLERGHRCPLDLARKDLMLPAEGPSLHPRDMSKLAVCGRLDLDSSGLLLFTQDGVLYDRLIGEQRMGRNCGPVEKEYSVWVLPAKRLREGQRLPLAVLPADAPFEQRLDLMRFGLELDGEQLREAGVETLALVDKRADGGMRRWTVRGRTDAEAAAAAPSPGRGSALRRLARWARCSLCGEN